MTQTTYILIYILGGLDTSPFALNLFAVRPTAIA
jgi:hypothetical protein